MCGEAFTTRTADGAVVLGLFPFFFYIRIVFVLFLHQVCQHRTASFSSSFFLFFCFCFCLSFFVFSFLLRVFCHALPNPGTSPPKKNCRPERGPVLSRKRVPSRQLHHTVGKLRILFVPCCTTTCDQKCKAHFYFIFLVSPVGFAHE